MAAERKLKAEIDKTLKKVQEGQEEFEDLWNQVHGCDNSNQREKLEDQLKKEIKKLQRLREQIKGWIANADIKDKQPLLDARKSIEKDMERFKVCEREMKMAGRAGVPKPTDPKDKAKEDVREWINNSVDSLMAKIEEMEYEMEELQGSVKKKQKPPARLTELEELATRHKEHIVRLEKVLRCIDNETIQPDESGMETLKESMDMYLAGDLSEENGYNPSDVDEMYEELSDRLEAVEAGVAAAPHGHKQLTKGKDKEESDKDRERERENEKQRAAVAAAKAQLIAQGNNNIKLNEEDESTLARKGSTAAAKLGTTVLTTATSATPAAVATAATGAVTPTAPAVPVQPPPPPPPAATRTQSGAFADKADTSPVAAANGGAAAVATQLPATPRGAQHSEPSPTQSLGTPVTGPARTAATGFGAVAGLGATNGGRAPGPTLGAATPPPAGTPPGNGVWGDAGAAQSAGKNVLLSKLAAGSQVQGAPSPGPAAPGSIQRGAPPGMAPAGAAGRPGAPPGYSAVPKAGDVNKTSSLLGEDGAAGSRMGSNTESLQAAMQGLGLESGGGEGGARQVPLPPMEPPNLPPIMAAYPTAAAKQILEQCYMWQPQPSDTDFRAYRPRHLATVPPSYPRAPHDVTEHPSLFRKMDPECLFFAFYFQPNSYQQLLAAHELKRQSWRFHKHHNAWFQRFTEPTVTNEEYEQGAYVYFDYNIMHDDMHTGWCYRRKENFTFRYDALEDELRAPPPAAAAAAVP